MVKEDIHPTTAISSPGQATSTSAPTQTSAPDQDLLTRSASAQQLITAGASGPQATTRDPAPARIGRYVVLERIGAGGMGAVYTAYDPHLDRKIAVKLMLPDHGGQLRTIGRQRFLREARAIAKVTHPNIVVVYDADFVGDELFIAMELVEGETLKDWLAHGPRSWREIARAFVQAGRGLAAAHAAGLVHRDFKPANVLITRDRTSKVLDFGLATLADYSGDGPGPGAASDISESIDSALMSESHPSLERVESQPGMGPLTRTGAVMGTPLYMAPEQHLTEPTDARTDQFSFCVALFEALYGYPPFGRTDNVMLVAARKQGYRIEQPPATSRVPARIRRALLRGLRPEREHRWPSMEHLLAQLDWRALAARRRNAMLLVAAVGLAGAGSAWVASGERGSQAAGPCANGAQRLTGVWDADIRASVQRAFLAVGVPYNQATWERVEPALDRYTQEWVAGYTEACEATQVHKVQSAELLDRRMSCYGSRLERLRALTTLFAGADATVIENAVRALHAVPPLEYCADREALLARVAPPSDPALRARVDQVRAQLEQASAMREAGLHQQARELSSSVVQAAEELGYMPLQAEAHMEQALALRLVGRRDDAAVVTRRAIWLAEACGHEEVTVDALTYLVSAFGSHGQAEVLRAEAAIMRTGREDLRWRLFTMSAGKAFNDGDYQQALIWFMRAQEHVGTHQLDSPVIRFLSMNNVAAALEAQGRYREACEWMYEALALAEQTLGPDHPRTVEMRVNAGGIAGVVGDYATALRYLTQPPDGALEYNAISLPCRQIELYTELGRHDEAERWARVLSTTLAKPETQSVWLRRVEGFTSWGKHLVQTGRAGRAIELIDAELPRLEQMQPAHNMHYIPLRGVLTRALLDRGELARARAVLDQTLAYQDRSLPPEHAYRAIALHLMGVVHHRQGAHDQALVWYQQALRVREVGLGPDHPHVGVLLVDMSVSLLASARARQAREHAQRAVGIHERAQDHPARLARARFALARALPAAEHQAAWRLAQDAEEAFARDGYCAAELAEVRAWRGRLPSPGNP